MKKTGIWMLVILCGAAGVFQDIPKGWAYTDEINAKVEDVWKAAQEIFEPIGIHKKNEKKKTLESIWIQDDVVRSRGWLKKLDKQHFRRRYKIRGKFKQAYDFVKVEISLNVQDLPQSGVRENMWRSVKPDYQDYQIEKETFMKILMRVEEYRKQSP